MIKNQKIRIIGKSAFADKVGKILDFTTVNGSQWAEVEIIIGKEIYRTYFMMQELCSIDD